MAHLIIQIPCLNEEATLPATLSALPREVDGFDRVEWLLIDDGSTDRSIEVARAHGIDHVVRHSVNLGLARAFMSGIREGLRLGADVIVNTDADNQYQAACIPDLVKPILDGRAQFVVGSRPIDDIESFSPIKKRLQRLGSAVVRIVSGSRIPDAPSGFRAIERSAAERLFVHSDYTYTIETIIQAGRQGIPMESVPVRVNRVDRPSRLFRSNAGYILRSVGTMIRVFLIYRPFFLFSLLSIAFFLPGLVLGLRYLVILIAGDGAGHVQSLILAAVLLIAAVICLAVGVLAHLIAANRRLLEDIRVTAIRDGSRTRAVEADHGKGS